MKTFKYLTIFVVSVFFIAGLTATGWSGPPKPGPAPSIGKPEVSKPIYKSIYKCPP